MPSLPQSLIVRPVVLRDTQPPELEDRDGQKSEALVQCKGKRLVTCCSALRHTQAYGARWDPPKGTEGAAQRAHQATFHHLSTVLAKLGRYQFDWRLAKVMLLYKNGWKEDPGELQACQPDLGAREGYGADHPECHHVAHAGQPGDQAQPAWVYERQVLLDRPDLLL